MSYNLLERVSFEMQDGSTVIISGPDFSPYEKRLFRDKIQEYTLKHGELPPPGQVITAMNKVTASARWGVVRDVIRNERKRVYTVMIIESRN